MYMRAGNVNGLCGYSFEIISTLFGMWYNVPHTIVLFQDNIWNNQQLSQICRFNKYSTLFGRKLHPLSRRFVLA